MADSGQETGIGNFVSVQVENGENDSICFRIQKFIGVPARRKWSGFRLSVTDHTGYDQIWVIVCRTIGM